jgi:predicted nucleic acid-binding protein
MGLNYLMDSNTAIQYVGNSYPKPVLTKLDTIVDAELLLSVITKIEVLGFNGEPKEMKKLEDFISMATIFQLTEEIVEKTIHLRKRYKIKIPDAIIAATAILTKSTLVTRNTTDFLRIEGLSIIDPLHL